MEDTTLFLKFGIALAIGAAVGLQREQDLQTESGKEGSAGLRTFTILGLMGCAASVLSQLLQSPLVFAAGLLLLGLLLAVHYYSESQRGHIGMTTSVSVVLVYLLGGLSGWGELRITAAVGVTLALLLSLKMELHGFAHRMSREDLLAALKFAAITAVVLPVLPQHAMGPAPFDVAIPFKVGLLVVFISGVGFFGYFLVKVAGPGRGIGLTGVLGGIASSTAVTLGLAGKSKDSPALSGSLAAAILVAWTVMFVRLLALVLVIQPELGQVLVVPFALPVAVGLAWCAWLYWGARHQKSAGQAEFNNPFRLGPALKFGLVFLVVLVIARSAQMWFGDAGVLLSSFLAGLADVDAIALGMTEMLRGGLDVSLAGKAVVLAALANTLTKGGMVVLLGAPELRRAAAPGIALMLAATAGSLLLLR